MQRLQIAVICISSAVLFLTCSAHGQASFSVITYGAVADGILRSDGAMAAGSPILTTVSGSFTAADVGKYIQVIGAGPGGSSHSDGVMTTGSAVLTSPSGTFASSDVGRGIVVIGAGANGGNLVARIQAYNSPTSVTLSVAAQSMVGSTAYYYGAMTLEGTIQSVQGNTTVTLTTPALAVVSSATFAYGTENHAAFQSAVDAAGQAGGGVVSVPAPSSCPSGAVCGYVIKTVDQATAKAPGAVKIRYNNVSLIGDAPQTNLFCRGAYGSYTNTVAFPGVTGNIRGFCLTIGDNGGPNGPAGEAVSNVTISKLHLFGMTNGNTFNVNFGYPPQSPTGDGWDITHKGIYMWDNSSFSNIQIDSVVIQDFKAENIYSGGSPITGMVIQNSTLTNFNGNGISMLAADLQVLNNTISNGSNAAVENSTVSTGAAALVRQLYQGNTISQFPREGIVVVGVDGGVASGTVQIVNNTFDTIAQTNPSGTQSAMYIASQNNYVPPANVTVTGNICHDCYSFGVFQTSGNTLIQGNTFNVDRYGAGNVFGFTYPINNATIANNTGSATANAQANGLSVGAIYVINPGWASGGFPWKNVVLKGNSWSFPGAPQYQFVTTSGLGWKLVTLDNLNWQGDTCNGCTHNDANHGLIDLSSTFVIEPYGPTVNVTSNSSVTATIDASKEEDGAQVQIVNIGSSPVSFVSDNNLSLSGTITLSGLSNSATFGYHASSGKFTLLSGGVSGPASITATGGTPQTTTVNTVFGTNLQASVKDASNNPVNGAQVIFTAPATGASATFSGSASVVVVTGMNGVATAPNLRANGTTGSYTISASVAGVATNAIFALTNTVSSAGPTLSGAGDSSSSAVNLTAEGAVDWEHWGDSALNHKAGVNSQLGNYTVMGTGSVLTYNNDPRSVNWNDGTPTGSSSANMNGIYIVGAGQGFSLTAPADTATRTVTLHVGGWFSGGTLTAHLSDNSAPDFTDATSTVNGQYDRNYTLTYRAGAAGQSLTLNWVMTSGTNYGNVTLNAVALSGARAYASAGSPQATPINSAFSTPLQVTVLDGGGNPVNGASVVFSSPVTGPSATFGGSASATVTTGINGIAAAPTLTANSQAGMYAVTASAAGAGAPITFSLTNTPGPPAIIVASAGAAQSTRVTTAFPIQLQAIVTDSGGNPVSGVTVTFSAPASGASAAFNGSATMTSTTNTSGVASASGLTANSQPGSYTVIASVASVSSSATFNLTNLAASAAAITPIAGTPQSATVNTAFGTSLQVIVKDAGNNPAAGATVTFAAPSTGATANFSGSATTTATTNASGIAMASTLTANGQAGSYSVTATVAGVPTPATFNLTNTPVATAGSGSLSGTGTSTNSTANLTTEGTADWVHWGDSVLNRKSGVTPLISNYTVVGTGPVMNYSNDPRALSWSDGTPTASASNNNGVYIDFVQNGFSFTVPADNTARTLMVHVGGWLSGGTLTAHLSDGSAADFVDTTIAASGQYDRNYSLTYNAASPGQTIKISWVATSGSGNVTLNAAALSVAGLPGVPASITPTAGTPQSAGVNTAFSAALQVTVKDAGNNLVSGATVTFTAPASGASATFSGSSTATATTNASGIATAPTLTANSQAGSYSVAASVAAVSTPATFSLTNLTGAPASIIASAGTPQSAGVNTAFSAALQVTVKDAGNNPVSGATVTFTAPASGASATFSGSSTATATTNASGIATAPTLTANSQAGSYSVAASVAAVSTAAAFNLTNTAVTSGGSGSLSGNGTSATGAANLTLEGATDWVHWGDAMLNRKSGVPPLLSNYTIVGTGPAMTYGNDPRVLSWSDGTPTASNTNNNGLYVNFKGNGFSFSVPADTTVRTLTVHAGGWMGGGTLTAHLSDSSAPDYVDNVATTSSQYDRNYTITFNAASAGQTLAITWLDTVGGNVTLSGAALR